MAVVLAVVVYLTKKMTQLQRKCETLDNKINYGLETYGPIVYLTTSSTLYRRVSPFSLLKPKWFEQSHFMRCLGPVVWWLIYNQVLVRAQISDKTCRGTYVQKSLVVRPFSTKLQENCLLDIGVEGYNQYYYLVVEFSAQHCVCHLLGLF